MWVYISKASEPIVFVASALSWKTSGNLFNVKFKLFLHILADHPVADTYIAYIMHAIHTYLGYITSHFQNG